MPLESWAIHNTAQLGLDVAQSGRHVYVSISKYRGSSATFYSDAATVTVTVNGSGAQGGSSAANAFPSSMPVGSWVGGALSNADFDLGYGVSNAHVVISWSYPGGGWASGSIAFDIAVSPFYDVPAAPTSVAATRVSDTSCTLAWTVNPTTSAPYTSQELFRSENNGAAIDTAALSGSATAYTATTQANTKYTFTVQARNSAGQTNSTASSTLLTTPAALASLVGSKVTGGIKLTFSKLDVPYTEAQILLEVTTNGGTSWSTVHTFAATDLSTTTTTDYTDTSAPSSGTVQYRATVKTNGGTQGVLAAASTLSVAIVLNTPPLAPTNLTPSGLVDVASPVNLAWEHTPSSDGALQSSRQVQYSTDSGATTHDIVVGNSTAQSYAWTVTKASFTAGQTVQWRVRTAGSQAGTYGAWSAWQTITLRNSLTVTITSPSGTWSGGDITVAWTDSEAWGSASQVAFRVVMSSGGVTAYDSGTITSAALSAVIPASVQRNLTGYTITATVTDNYGLTSLPATTLISTNFLTPAMVELTWSYDDDLGQLVLTPDFDPETSSAFDDTVSWMLERSIDGATWSEIGVFSDDNPVPDAFVRTGADSWYRTTGYTSLGVAGEQTIFTVPRADVKSRWGRIAFGDGLATQVRFGWSETKEIDSSRASDVFDIEGMEFPVAVFGTQKSRKLAIVGKLLYTSSPQAGGISATLITATKDDMIAVQETAGVCLYRDGDGSWWTCRITDLKVTPKGPTFPGTPDQAGVSFTIERVTA